MAATEEAETAGTRTGVVVTAGEAEVMEESVAGEENSAGTGRTETGLMTGTETEISTTRETVTERETGGTAEGINPLLRATTLSIRGHNMTATKASQVLSVFGLYKRALQTRGNVQKSNHVFLI